MIEAFLLFLELLFIVVLLRAINNSTANKSEQSLGIFHFKNLRTDIDIKIPAKGANKNA